MRGDGLLESLAARVGPVSAHQHFVLRRARDDTLFLNGSGADGVLVGEQQVHDGRDQSGEQCRRDQACDDDDCEG